MAGYLITLNDEDALAQCILTGSYSTILSPPKNDSWGVYHEGTFADYISMKENDRVFFFIRRKIYGCGQLKKINVDCKYLNYIDADIPKTTLKNTTTLLEYGSLDNRCFCLFEPSPAFFKEGVDMDEVLQNKECPFHSVRTLWKLSFIKMDDEESDVLFGIILKHNEESIKNEKLQFLFKKTFHDSLRTRNLEAYQLSYASLINACREKNVLKHEMAIEATLCGKLTHENTSPFGKWDYISHQVAASPFKPIDYMDKMDIFGYRYIPGYFVKSKYIIGELKKGSATKDVVEQIMKYVDWVSDEYANGDYSMIEAYIIASEFDSEIKQEIKKHCIRNYNKGFRPTRFCTWNFVKLVKYHAVENDLEFKVINTE